MTEGGPVGYGPKTTTIGLPGTPVRFICATCGYHTLYARYLVEHVMREGQCRSCGFRHDAGDCPRWPVTP